MTTLRARNNRRLRAYLRNCWTVLGFGGLLVAFLAIDFITRGSVDRLPPLVAGLLLGAAALGGALTLWGIGRQGALKNAEGSEGMLRAGLQLLGVSFIALALTSCVFAGINIYAITVGILGLAALQQQWIEKVEAKEQREDVTQVAKDLGVNQ